MPSLHKVISIRQSADQLSDATYTPGPVFTGQPPTQGQVATGSLGPTTAERPLFPNHI